ncbi:MAG TPA: PAS domain-containing protein [Desulfonatronum sp.]|nr:PAS domain-containing protein [Desulfonatronum sp.]
MDMTDTPTDNAILNHLAVGVFTVDHAFRITSFNKKASEITGFGRHKALGRRCYEIFRADTCSGNCPLKRAMENNAEVIKQRVKIISQNNREVPVEVSTSVLRDRAGQVVGGVETLLDDSARTLLEKQIERSYTFEDILGRSKPILDLFEILPTMAASDVTVLVQGETGTGKGLIAHALHNTSPRREKPFVKVNCAALPQNLLESELFGYRQGAFTDARKDKPGLFEMAGAGTIFLDEVGDLPMAMQAKLLQVLEDRQYYALGAVHPSRMRARILASTNRDLEDMVAQGAFRGDLYYRLKVAVVEAPPLRNRQDDILLLAQHFLRQAAALEGKHLAGLAPDALQVLMEHAWPGNVRELKNVMDYAALVCDQGMVRREELPRYLLHPPNCCLEASLTPAEAEPPQRNQEQERLAATLNEHGWNRQAAANSLGVSRTTLWRLMRKHNLGCPRSTETLR